jgi:hypothetical protein
MVWSERCFQAVGGDSARLFLVSLGLAMSVGKYTERTPKIKG